MSKDLWPLSAGAEMMTNGREIRYCAMNEKGKMKRGRAHGKKEEGKIS